MDPEDANFFRDVLDDQTEMDRLDAEEEGQADEEEPELDEGEFSEKDFEEFERFYVLQNHVQLEEHGCRWKYLPDKDLGACRVLLGGDEARLKAICAVRAACHMFLPFGLDAMKVASTWLMVGHVCSMSTEEHAAEAEKVKTLYRRRLAQASVQR